MTWMKKDATTTTHPKPPSGACGISSSQLWPSLLLFIFRLIGGPCAIFQIFSTYPFGLFRSNLVLSRSFEMLRDSN